MSPARRVPPEDAPVERLHLRSTVPGVDHLAIEAWCVREGTAGGAGVGWGLWSGEEYTGISWDAYVRNVGGEGADPNVVLLRDLPVGALVWARLRDSSYWLGRLQGEWEYRDGDEAQRLDMFNVRRCRWRKVGTQDAVPGKVVNNFSARKTLNPVADWGAVEYTRRLYRQLTGETSELQALDPADVGSLLGAVDLEDLVAAYLQDRHNLVLVSRGHSTVGYEYVLRDRDTGRKAVATVKSGGAPVDLDALPTGADVDVWAYAVQERNWTGAPRDDVRWISTKELVDFLNTRRHVLPDQVNRWLA